MVLAVVVVVVVVVVFVVDVVAVMELIVGRDQPSNSIGEHKFRMLFTKM